MPQLPADPPPLHGWKTEGTAAPLPAFAARLAPGEQEAGGAVDQGKELQVATIDRVPALLGHLVDFRARLLVLPLQLWAFLGEAGGVGGHNPSFRGD